MGRILGIIIISFCITVSQQLSAIALKTYIASDENSAMFGVLFPKGVIKKYKSCNVGNNYIAVFQLQCDYKVNITCASNVKNKFITCYKITKHGEFFVLNVQFAKNVKYQSSRCSASSINICVRDSGGKHVVVIDPGHGGMDPGTTTPYVKEKNITLKIAKILKVTLEKTNRYTVYLTRDNDTFASSSDRLRVIEKTSPDVFISLHADSINDRRVRGMVVYTYPKHSRSDNESDMNEVSSYLFSRSSYYASRNLANKFLRYIPQICKIHKNTMRVSKIRVLRNMIPSILVELGYVTNMRDNALLNSDLFREKFAQSVVYALDDFLGKK